MLDRVFRTDIIAYCQQKWSVRLAIYTDPFTSSFSNLIINCHDYYYILSMRFFLESKRISNARVVSVTKKEHRLAVYFL